MPPADDRIHGVALLAILATAAAIATGLALGIPLLALVLESRGVSGTWIGLNTAVAGLASLVVPFVVTPLARALGTARLLIGSLVTVAATFYAFHLFDDVVIWFVLRGLFHGALTIAFVVSEFWLVMVSPPEKRGLMVGVYATVFSVGLAVGPMLLALTGSEGTLPFAVGTLVLAATIVPTLFARRDCPVLDQAPGHSPVAFVAAAPAATFGVLAFGAVESGGLSFLPLWGLAAGLDETRAAWLLTAVGLGNVVLQIPVGLLADRCDKTRLLAAVSLVGVVGAAALPFTAAHLPATLAVLFVWGGTVAGLYTVGLSALADRFHGSDLAGANAAFVAMYGVGMLVGPAAIGVGLDLAPTSGAPVVMAAFFALHLALLAALGTRTRL
jgi:predicted MFS family arabinose efflux permease